MAANRLTQIGTETLSGALQRPTPNIRLTQIGVETLFPSFATIGAPASSFNLQKLVLTVKEATVPVRGRNQ